MPRSMWPRASVRPSCSPRPACGRSPCCCAAASCGKTEGGPMLRVDALRAIYPELTRGIVVTNMGAAPAELFSLGHQPGFFYLWHSMGLASSVGLGIALSRPEPQVVGGD